MNDFVLPVLTDEQAKKEPKNQHIVNIAELKKQEKQKGKPAPVKDEEAPKTILLWILYGAAGSMIFVLLGLVNSQFFYLTPMGPILGAAAWLIRRLLRRKGFDKNHY